MAGDRSPSRYSSRRLPEVPVSRSVRVRAFNRAARAWRAGYPHQALEILRAAGLEGHWPEFRDQALRRARERYVRLIRITS